MRRSAQPSRRQEGFCSRAIPGPGPSQNPALCGSPPTKCRTFGGCLFVEVVARAGVWWGVGRPAASGTPYRTTKKTSARFAHYRSSPLSCTPRWVALLQGKPRCGLLSIQLLQSTVRRACQSTSAVHYAPMVAACP